VTEEGDGGETKFSYSFCYNREKTEDLQKETGGGEEEGLVWGELKRNPTVGRDEGGGWSTENQGREEGGSRNKLGYARILEKRKRRSRRKQEGRWKGAKPGGEGANEKVI